MKSRSISAVVLMTLIAVGRAEPAGARPGPSTTGDDSCSVQLSRPDPARPNTKVDRVSCGASNDVEPTAGYVLVKFYSSTLYRGRSYTHYAPSPCNSVGYHLSDTSQENAYVGGVVSYKLGDAGCTHSLYFFNKYLDMSAPFGDGKLAVKQIKTSVLGHLWSFRAEIYELPCVAEPDSATACET